MGPKLLGVDDDDNICDLLRLYRCRGAQMSIIKQMSRQGSHGSAGDYQADEQAGVTRLSWRISSR